MNIRNVSPQKLQRIPLMVGFFLAFLTALGGMSLIESIKSHDREQLSFELYKTSVEIIDSLNDGFEAYLDLEYLVGFVILGGRGELLTAKGQWESPILVEQPNGFWDSDNLIVYHRQLSGGGVASTLRDSPGSGRQMVLWYDPSSFLLGLQQRNRILYLGLILLTSLMIVAGFLTQKLYQAQARIDTQERLAILGQVARTISHEIQNPLAALDLHRQLAQRKAELPIQPHLEVIHHESERIKQIITHVRQLIHPDSADTSEFDLVSWLETLIATYICPSECQKDSDDQTETDNQQLNSLCLVLVNKQEITARVKMPPQHLDTIIRNLITNGFQSQEINHTISPLTIRLSRTKSLKPFLRTSLSIEIIDQGIGFKSSESGRLSVSKEQLFDPFFTTKAQGTGLGLSLSRTLARQAGGDLCLELPPQGGCIARLTLPQA